MCAAAVAVNALKASLQPQNDDQLVIIGMEICWSETSSKIRSQNFSCPHSILFGLRSNSSVRILSQWTSTQLLLSIRGVFTLHLAERGRVQTHNLVEVEEEQSKETQEAANPLR